MYSYIRFEPGTHIITDIREKVPISRHANTGAYAFPCGRELRNACAAVLDNPAGEAGEFYISAALAKMIQRGGKVSTVCLVSSLSFITFRCESETAFAGDHSRNMPHQSMEGDASDSKMI